MKHTRYKFFYKVEGVDVWKSYEFNAKSDMEAIRISGEYEKGCYDKIVARGLERLTVERVF